MSDIAGTQRVEVAATRERCVALLLDFERYPAWYDTLDGVTVREHGPAGEAAVVDFAADAGPLGSVEFSLRLRYALPSTLEGSQVAGNGKIVRVRQRWRLDEAAPGTTAVAYEFEADAGGLAVKLALRAARALVERDLVRRPPEALKRTLERAPNGARAT